MSIDEWIPLSAGLLSGAFCAMLFVILVAKCGLLPSAATLRLPAFAPVSRWSNLPAVELEGIEGRADLRPLPDVRLRGGRGRVDDAQQIFALHRVHATIHQRLQPRRQHGLALARRLRGLPQGIGDLPLLRAGQPTADGDIPRAGLLARIGLEPAHHGGRRLFDVGSGLGPARARRRASQKDKNAWYEVGGSGVGR
ncbi:MULTISPECIES: hypothetical protein [Lonsdalea]|uniref:hypothetical protein n=1 Tax=Lonsdalea TaxID=1082702 RepID=UPI00111C5143|nr:MULTISPECIES: hypothetical protein [Lonsdalea]QPQ23386.1 hypothetical protein I6N93_12115 [Lonsdalea populi]